MSILRNTPYPGMNFLVDLGDGQVDGPEAGVIEVVFPESCVQSIEYRSGNDKENAVRRTLTVTKYGNLILTRGVFGSLGWYSWWSAVRDGDAASLRTIRVSLLTEDHSAIVLGWKFLRSRPVNHQYSPLNAIGAVPFTERLEIAFERLEME